MDIDELKAELTVSTEAALLTGDLLADAVESGDYEKALGIVGTYRALVRTIKNLRRQIVTEVAG